MKGRNRDEVTINVRRALLQLDERDLAGCLLGLEGGLRTVDHEAPTGDRWRHPDAVWRQLVAADPPLACFPLGGTAERAVKRAVAAGGNGRSLVDRVLTSFLTELALDLLRRSQSWQTHDSPYRYRFAAGRGVLVPVDEELAWRRRLDDEAAGLAAALRPYLDAAAAEARFEDAAGRLAEGFEAVFAARPEPSPGPLVAAADVTSSAGAGGTCEYKPGERPLDFRFGPAGNVSVRLHPPRRCGVDRGTVEAGDPPLPLPPLAQDLLHVGATVYLADLSLPRRHNLGRRLHFEIVVHRPEAWNRLSASLAAAVSSLARDDVCFSFYPDPLATRDGGLSDGIEVPRPRRRHAVLLFSGGLDSLAGAVHLLGGGMGAIDCLHLVSHYADTRLSAVQKGLADALGKRHAGRVVHHSLFVGRGRSSRRGLSPSSPPFNPLVQYLRSTLFLSAAAALAVATGSGRIFVCENGPLALGPTFCEGHVPTRTAHPRLLARFEGLIGELLGDAAPTVENPFIYATKGEVVGALVAHGAADLAERTDSCWTAGAVARTHLGIAHDGTCLPCFIRRAALAKANINESDRGARYSRRLMRRGRKRSRPVNRVPGYLRDVLRQFATAPADHKLLVADHLRFSATVRELAAAGRWDELLAYAPDLSLDLENIEPQELAATWSRHADELFAFVASGGGELRTAFG